MLTKLESYHREHAILLGKKRLNKEVKRMIINVNLRYKNVFGLHIMTREATRKFARVSKFRSLHDAKKTQVERFFYNLAEFVFE